MGIAACKTQNLNNIVFYEINKRDGVCGIYQISDPDKIHFRHIEDRPIDDCPDMLFSLTPQDTATVLDILRRESKDDCLIE